MAVKYNVKKVGNPHNDTAILIIHGYGDHIGRYELLFETFASYGFMVIGQDFRGHGQSDGERAFVNTFQEYIHDLEILLQTINQPNIYLYAHSMGALVAAHYLIDHKDDRIKKVMFSSGLFKVSDSVAPVLRKVAPLVSRLLPRFGATKIDSGAISTLSNEQDRYNQDPLNFHGKVPARVGYELMKAMTYAQDHVSRINLPVWLMHGTADPLNDVEGSKAIYNKLPHPACQLHLIDGGYHELINDFCRDRALEVAIDFIKS